MISEIQDPLYRSIWDEFWDKFQFSPNVKSFPGILEPTPSITYSLADADDVALEESNRIFYKSIPVIFAPDETVYFLDWQHSCYQFSPDSDITNSLVTFYPDGDYAVIINPSMSVGIFGHPWERTLCFFGQECLRYFANHPMPMMGDLIRKKDVS